MARRGLIVGKFYPPHRGHKHLIDTAQAQVDELYVIVCQKPGEDPRGELRAAWLREIHPQAHVLLIDDTYDENDSRVWAENSIRWLGFVPDVVFTSEEYGPRFAEHLGCEHVFVDPPRRNVPISGTQVRADPLGSWEYLEPPVRAYYAVRVCLVGAESTGKSTLAASLAAHYGTVWVREYGREYSEEKLRREGAYRWTSEEFTHIAAMQCRREDEAAGRSNRVLISDTDAFTTGIWHRRYLNERSADVDAIAAAHQRPDLYLLTRVDIPFVQDGTRDGEQIRGWMHDVFVEELTREQRPFKIVSGSQQERFRQAVSHIDDLLRRSPEERL